MSKRLVFGSCVWSLLLVGGSAVSAHAGPSAQEILKKAQALIEGAKTYQATVLVNNNAGKSGTMTMRVDVKNSGKKGYLATTLVGQPTGQFVMAAGMAGSQIVDDGATLYIYNPAMKTYVKRPSSGGAATRNPLANLTGVMKSANVTLGPNTSVAGKPVYTVILTPKQKMNGPDKMTLLVEQANYHIRQMRIDSASRAPGGKGAQPVTVTIQVQNEKFNDPIPASAFRFTPPAGAKEMQMGAMMGGLGGGPPKPKK